MTQYDSPLAFAVVALVFLVLLFVFAWQVIAPKDDPRAFARKFLARRIDGVLRLWRFIGPRLTHKPTVAMFLGNAAILFGVDVEQMNQLTVALWLGANLMFPPWDDLPNETLATAAPFSSGPRPDADPVLA